MPPPNSTPDTELKARIQELASRMGELAQAVHAQRETYRRTGESAEKLGHTFGESRERIHRELRDLLVALHFTQNEIVGHKRREIAEERYVQGLERQAARDRLSNARWQTAQARQRRRDRISDQRWSQTQARWAAPARAGLPPWAAAPNAVVRRMSESLPGFQNVPAAAASPATESAAAPGPASSRPSGVRPGPSGGGASTSSSAGVAGSAARHSSGRPSGQSARPPFDAEFMRPVRAARADAPAADKAEARRQAGYEAARSRNAARVGSASGFKVATPVAPPASLPVARPVKPPSGWSRAASGVASLFGKLGSAAAEASSSLSGLGGSAGVALPALGALVAGFELATSAATAWGGLLGGLVQAASPNLWRTLTGSLELLAAKIGLAAAPLVMQFIAKIQELGDAWDSLDDATKSLYASFLFLEPVIKGFADWISGPAKAARELATAPKSAGELWDKAKAAFGLTQAFNPLNAPATNTVRRVADGVGRQRRGEKQQDDPQGGGKRLLLDLNTQQPRFSSVESVWENMAMGFLQETDFTREIAKLVQQAVGYMTKWDGQNSAPVKPGGGGFSPGTGRG